MQTTKVRVACQDETGALPPIWRSFGYDEINWTTTPRGKQLLHEIGQLSRTPCYIRCHHTFTSGNGLSFPTRGSTNICRGVERDGLRLDFTILDQVIETLLQNNCKPVVELGFMPDVLSRGPARKPAYDYSLGDLWRYPPKDYKNWQELVYRTVEHYTEKFGAEEVSTWYWELWNEPDNPGFFAGSFKEYCKMYDFAVAGAEAALARVKIGGPALATDAKFLDKFLRHCSRDKNFATHARGARLDFISFHAKGTEWPLKGKPFPMPSLRKIFMHLKEYDRVLQKYPHYRELPVLFDECDMAVATNFGVYDFPEFEINNTEYFAIFVLRLAKYLSDFISETHMPIQFFTTWAFYFEGKRFFEGNRALFTNENIKKPVFNAFALFELLGERRLQLHLEPASPSGRDYETFPQIDGMASAHADGSISVLLWNFDEQGQTDSRNVVLELSQLPGSQKKVYVQRIQIDHSHSNAHTVWKSLGGPLDPTPQQIALIKRCASLDKSEPAREVAVESSSAEVEVNLPGQSVCLITVSFSK
ncbi:MAG: hypothetical protein ACE5IY_08980 [bacterium]